MQADFSFFSVLATRVQNTWFAETWHSRAERIITSGFMHKTDPDYASVNSNQDFQLYDTEYKTKDTGLGQTRSFGRKDRQSNVEAGCWNPSPTKSEKLKKRQNLAYVKERYTKTPEFTHWEDL